MSPIQRNLQRKWQPKQKNYYLLITFGSGVKNKSQHSISALIHAKTMCSWRRKDGTSPEKGKGASSVLYPAKESLQKCKFTKAYEHKHSSSSSRKNPVARSTKTFKQTFLTLTAEHQATHLNLLIMDASPLITYRLFHICTKQTLWAL